MPRSDSAGKYNNNAGGGGGAINADRVQPGRVMLILRDALVDDELVYQIALQAGEVKSVHRPQTNRQLVFVQYEQPSDAEHAMTMMRQMPIFKGVDPAIKSERFVNDKSGGSGGNTNNNTPNDSFNDNDQQQRNANMNNQFNKGGGNRQQKGGNNFNMKNNNFKPHNNSMNGETNLMTIDFDSPQGPSARTTNYQPKFSLGCWSCTKMPSYECRCGAFYCDDECQRADWPVHKDICMPRLVPISSSNNKILQQALSSSMFSSGVSSGSYSPSNRDSQSYYQQQQQQQRQPQYNQQQQQQNQNNRRGQTNNAAKGGNQGAANQQQNQTQKKDSPRTPSAAQQPTDLQQTPPKSSPPEETGSDKVNRLGNKLQRLKMAKSGAVTKGVLQAAAFPRDGSMVKITASLPSGVIYIYHNNGKDGQHSDYMVLTNRLLKAADEASSLKAAPPVDDVIFAPFQGGYFRAKVLAVNGEKLKVFYVDFGNSDTVEWKQSREIADDNMKWAKYLTYPVTLEGVESFSGEMVKLLETLEHMEEFEMVRADVVPGSEVKSVVLKRPKQSLTLNMELMELKERELRERKQREQERLEKERLEKELKAKQEQAAQKPKVDVQIADPNNYQEVLFDESMEIKQLPSGVTKKLMIIDASEVLETSIISVVAAENVAQYGHVVEQCDIAGTKDKNVYQPTKEGEVCLALHKQEGWSRALYDKSEGNYMLLDVGILTSVPEGNVRRFPPQLSHVVYNNEVLVENLPKLKALMKDGKPEDLHGMMIDAKTAPYEDGVSISIVDA